MKRKLSSSDGDDDDEPHSDALPATFSASRRKRVRYNSLERTLAHMTLGSAFTATSEDVDVGMWPKVSLPRPREQGTLDVVLPSSVEEPDAPASESVDMEVEPTLPSHGAHGWESIATGQLDIKEVQISPTVLECLRRHTKCPPAPLPLPLQTSQALVLYRAPQSPPLQQLERGPDQQEASMVVRGDDVMEVE